jgi:hypothetical protein
MIISLPVFSLLSIQLVSVFYSTAMSIPMPVFWCIHGVYVSIYVHCCLCVSTLVPRRGLPRIFKFTRQCLCFSQTLWPLCSCILSTCILGQFHEYKWHLTGVWSAFIKVENHCSIYWAIVMLLWSWGTEATHSREAQSALCRHWFKY